MTAAEQRGRPREHAWTSPHDITSSHLLPVLASFPIL